MKKNVSKKQLHVVHIIPRLGFGGAERFVVELTKQISSKIIRQSVITLWNDQPLKSELPQSVKCISLDFNSLGRIHRVARLIKLFRKMKADVVHTHLFSADMWGRIAAHRAGIPVITTEHNINKDEPKMWEFVKRGMKSFSRVYTAPSQAVAHFMQKAYRILPEHIRVIPHGIEVKNFFSIPPSVFEPPFTLSVIGRLVPQKGHRIVLDALRELKDIPCKLVIVGSGQLEKELKDYAERIGVGAKVEWKAALHDVTSVYAKSDIILVPSLWEGLGIVVLEAMASERLVIASNVDGIPENIQAGKTGMLVPPKDSRALARMIRDQLKRKEASLTIAKQARVWVQAHGDVKKMADEYKKIYLEMKV